MKEKEGIRRQARGQEPTASRPSRRKFTITSMKPEQTTSGGNLYLECETTVGTIAFWGDRTDQSNIRAIERHNPPLSVTADCIESNWDKHDFWVPQRETVIVHE